jgi:large subunit ribosomal protein L33
VTFTPALSQREREFVFVPRRKANPAMAKGGKRKKKVETVFLVCDETGDYNYTLRRKMGGEKLKLNKYSPRLRRHTPHTEKKK